MSDKPETVSEAITRLEKAGRALQVYVDEWRIDETWERLSDAIEGWAVERGTQRPAQGVPDTAERKLRV